MLISHATQIHDRITNPAARDSILRFRAALQQVEREVPGLINVFVSEVVDSVEVRLCLSVPRALRVVDADPSSSSSARSLSPRASNGSPPPSTAPSPLPLRRRRQRARVLHRRGVVRQVLFLLFVDGLLKSPPCPPHLCPSFFFCLL